ncbi:Alpha/Beta hydrolase protein [Cokeromyces recurvatus]|uniref:Alpha/Beta hydrolase protein n=1 Tax=Cokeromyces recurvatus TaxID=90255 RepID=UPI002220EDC4|nr:Alpha/Beta hydrolase protein [Cokeromyces recurvatus]KAI7905680.1 Alpha/Beta hydrolase protein [Cokeromyces recurvatus]
MDDIHKVIKKTAPSFVVLKTLRTTLTMPPPIARNIIKDLTRPLGYQKRFVRKFDNENWKGTLIMSEMIRCNDDIALKRLQKSDIVIFNIHGGGFRVGHSAMYMESFISWLRLFKKKYNLYACIMSIEYGLAPKHKYPGPLNECIKAFNYLTKDLGVSPSKIILSGDSAGGELVLETLIRTYSPSILNNLDSPRENFDLPLPAGALLSSPLVSPKTTSESWKRYAKTDMVSLQLANLVHKEYLGLSKTKEAENDDLFPIMRLIHIQKNFDRFLPKHVLVFIGEKEVLHDDVVEMVNYIKTDGKVNIQLIKEKYAHDWFLIHEIIKKKDKAAVIAKYDELFVDFAVKAVIEGESNHHVQGSSRIIQQLRSSYPTEECVVHDYDKKSITEIKEPVLATASTIVKQDNIKMDEDIFYNSEESTHQQEDEKKCYNNSISPIIRSSSEEENQKLLFEKNENNTSKIRQYKPYIVLSDSLPASKRVIVKN